MGEFLLILAFALSIVSILVAAFAPTLYYYHLKFNGRHKEAEEYLDVLDRWV